MNIREFCRPVWITTYVALFVAMCVVIGVFDLSFVGFVLAYLPVAGFVALTSPRRRIRGQGITACDCPRHLKKVPVEDRPDWGSDF